MSSITWMGATYSSVSQVTLPKTGGGVATFTEGGGGGGSDFVVTLDWDSVNNVWTPDRTFAEIHDAWASGQTIVLDGSLTDGFVWGAYMDEEPPYYEYCVGMWVDDPIYGIDTQEYNDYTCSSGGVALIGTWKQTIPNYENPTMSFTPTESVQTASVTYDLNDGYNGLGQVDVTVGAISPNYVGSNIPQNDGTPSEQGGNWVVFPAGYYDDDFGYTIGYGTVTAPSTITGTSATVSTGTNTLTLSKTVSVTPSVTTQGYVSVGTAGNSNVSLTANVTTKGATTYHPSSTDQTVASGTYTTGTQTFKAVTTSNLTADNIKSGVVVKVGDSTDDDCVASVTGTYTGGGGSSYTLLASTQLAVNTTSTSAGSAGTINLGSAGYTKDKIIWVHIRDHAGKRNGYFYGSDTFYVNSYKANNSTTSFSACAVEYIRVDSNGNYTTATGSYGVYGYSINSSGTLTIRRRYNSTNTLTINGTFDVSVYAMDMPTGLKVFD